MAKIDILLPVRNGAPFLAEAIWSLRRQTIADWRLIVLDHGSSDESADIAAAHALDDDRIDLRQFPDAAGLSDLLNRGLDLADCDYVMRHDADDIALPDRIEKSLRAFAEQPHCVVMGGQAEIVDAQGALKGMFVKPTDADRITAGCFFWNPFIHPTVMMDFRGLQQANARYGADFLGVAEAGKSIAVPRLAEDYLLFAQFALIGKAGNSSETMIQYRHHGAAVGASNYAEQMFVSLAISRFLMHSFCNEKRFDYVDPAPFCNHGGALFDIEGQHLFRDCFDRLEKNLRAGFGDTPGLNREIAYRRNLADRRPLMLAARHLMFNLSNSVTDDEQNAIREWLTGSLRGRAPIRVAYEERP